MKEEFKMKYCHEVLSNEITLITARNSYVHSFTIGFYFKGGLLYEEENVNGISHLLEHLFFRRMNHYSQKELYSMTNRLGTTFRGITYANAISFDIEALPQFLRQSFDILINILKEFSWTDEEIEKEKNVVFRQIDFESDLSFPKTVDTSYFEHTNKSLPIMGTVETIETISPDDIHGWKQKIFCPSNLCCVVTGNFSKDDICYIKDCFNKLEDKSKFSLCEKSIKPKNFCKRDKHSDIILQEEWDVSDVFLSFDIPPDVDRYKAILLNSILGEGDGSLLTMALREERGLTDTIDFYVDNYRELAKLNISYSVYNKSLIESLTICSEIIKKLSNNVSEEELADTILFYTDNYRMHYDTSRSLNFITGYQHFILNQEYNIPKIINAYKKIKIADLLEAAKKIFIPQNLMICVTNNKKLCKMDILKKALVRFRKQIE